ncbi:MAG TPA: glycosyltransferase family 87 protein [Stellaceae bacterium]|nr:glycosyltransferase family 87 protein [Stellaceae bacterium]
MAGLERIYEALRNGDLLGRARILAYARILFAVEVAVFLFLIAGTHGWIVKLDHPLTTDFASFYAAGDLADAGHPELAYDQAAHFAAEQAATEKGIAYQFFYYPPVFLLICAVLAHLPYLIAFVVFEALSLALYLVVARRILDEPLPACLVPMLAFPAVFWTIGLGQNALLTASLFGAGMLCVDRRSAWAGLFFGALCYKPHLALLVPVALIAGRRWGTFAVAAATVAALACASAALFGWETWQAYLGVALNSHATYEFGRINLAGMISPFAAARLIGLDVGPAYAVQGVAAAAAAALVAYVWWNDLSLELRGAALAAATLFAVPVILLYDFMLAAVAAAFLTRAARMSGFQPWEKAGLALVFAVPLLALGFGQGWHVPVGPLASLLLLAMVLARSCREAAGKNPALSRAEPGYPRPSSAPYRS